MSSRKIAAKKRTSNEKTLTLTNSKLIVETPKKKQKKSTDMGTLPINRALVSDSTNLLLDITEEMDDDMIAEVNLCVKCGVDMGKNNPRQLCGKTKCLNEIPKRSNHASSNDEDSNDDDDDEVNGGRDEVDSDIVKDLPPQMKKKKRKQAFLSMEDFAVKVEEEKPVSWADLDQKQIYFISHVKNRWIPDGEGKRLAYIAELEDEIGDTINVWLPGVAAKAALESMEENNEKDIYIQSIGKKYNPKSRRTYNNFNILAV